MSGLASIQCNLYYTYWKSAITPFLLGGLVSISRGQPVAIAKGICFISRLNFHKMKFVCASVAKKNATIKLIHYKMIRVFFHCCHIDMWNSLDRPTLIVFNLEFISPLSLIISNQLSIVYVCLCVSKIHNEKYILICFVCICRLTCFSVVRYMNRAKRYEFIFLHTYTTNVWKARNKEKQQ